MTKQKFYEECILKTYTSYSEKSKEIDKEINLIFNHPLYPPKTFSQLMIIRDLCGCKINIPVNHPFDKLGFKYIAQICRFVLTEQDDEFTNDFFKFLDKVKKNKKILDVKNEEHVGILYDSFVDSVGSYREFSNCMSDFILCNCKKSKYYDKVLSLTKALGFGSIGFIELSEMSRKH